MEFEDKELKNNLRKLFLLKRAEFSASSDVDQLNEDLARNLAANLPKVSKGYWASYCAFSNEANPSKIEQLTQFQWCYPVIDGEVLSFYENPKAEWVLNSLRIREPSHKNQKIPLEQIEGVLVPGIAFDLKGYRLGWGKAFYDKTLKNYTGKKIGVAYSIQLTESLPHSGFDIPVDMIVTEREVIKIRERKVS